MGSLADLRRFGRKYGILLRNTDHEFYLVTHPITGEQLLLKVSHGQGEIPSNLWKRILGKQLKLTQEEFSRFNR